MQIKFECKYPQTKESWTGEVTKITFHGNHYEANISARGSNIRVIFGNTTSGNFACIPDYGAGCDLASLDDLFYNKEALMSAIGEIDGISVATALKTIQETVFQER